MTIDWLLSSRVHLGGTAGDNYILPDDAKRQERTARVILQALHKQPGIVLADEVGMGKTYIALSVIASVLERRGRRGPPVVVMLPPGLVEKWRREWKQFQRACCDSGSFDWVTDAYAYEALQFLRFVDGDTKADLVWVTTNCFDREFRDPWIELAIVRWARETMHLDDETKRSIYKWAAPLVKRGPRSGLTERVMERLLESPPEQWHPLLVDEGVLGANDPWPVPRVLINAKFDARNWKDLREFLRSEVPGRRGRPAQETVSEVGKKLRKHCRRLLPELIAAARWVSPLLVLDEAHHAKNDKTKLARLFRSHEFFLKQNGSAPRLANRFCRMLFLTATPFQLGHAELIRVLQSFAAVQWVSQAAPSRTRKEFLSGISKLEERLSESRTAARNLDRTWARLRWEEIDPSVCPEENEETRLAAWWARVEKAPKSDLELELLSCVQRCRQAREVAEFDAAVPWESLRTWVLRSNRPTHLAGNPPLPRRELRIGEAIVSGREAATSGLPLTAAVALPFLLAARAQGEMAAVSDKTAFFAQGLASSYEAFHHTRQPSSKEPLRDTEYAVIGPGEPSISEEPQGAKARAPGVPVDWKTTTPIP